MESSNRLRPAILVETVLKQFIRNVDGALLSTFWQAVPIGMACRTTGDCVVFANRFSKLSPLWQGTIGEWFSFSVTLMVLIVVTWSVHRWWIQYRGRDDAAEIDRNMLTTIRDLKREGDLTEEEYRSIKGHLVERISQHELLQSLTKTTGDASESDNSAEDDSAPGDEFKES